MGFLDRRHQMGWAALIIGASIVLSRLMGLVRDKVIAYLFGAGVESDIYFAAFVIPDFINHLLAGAYFPITLIPLLAAYFDRDREDGWRFFSAVFTWTFAGIVLLTALGMLFAADLARLAAPGLDPVAAARLTRFLRIILPAQVCFIAGSCVASILYLRKQFLAPALAPLLYNAGIILGGLMMRGRGMEGFCWGVLAGAFVGNFLVPLLVARRGEGLHFRPVWRHPGLGKFALIALPLMIGQSIVLWDEQFCRIFGSLAGKGVVSRLNYARRIMMVPVGAVAQAAGVAAFPFLAELVARGKFERFNRTLNTTLRNTLLLLIPLSAWLMVAAEPAILLVFQQGRFTPQDTAQTAWLLRIYAAGAFCWGFHQILGRGFYANQDTVRPVVWGTAATLLGLPAFFLGARYFGARGVAAASAGSVAVYTVFLGFCWRRRFGAQAFSGIGNFALQVAALSAAAAVPAWAFNRACLSHLSAHPYLAALLSLAITGALYAAATYWFSVRVLGIPLPCFRKPPGQ